MAPRVKTKFSALTFRITTCRSLLAVAFRAWDLICVNLSFASGDFVCPRMTSIRIGSSDRDYYTISETWLSSGSAIGEIQLENYTFIHKPSSTIAGGVDL